MRRRLRKWLGIAALVRKQAELVKRIEALECAVPDLQSRLMELDGRLPARAKPSKPQPQQMANWSEFLRTVGQGEEINAN